MEFKIRKEPIEEGNKLFQKTKLIIEHGKVSCIVGCNGSGKTTLISEIKDNLYAKGAKELKKDFYHNAFKVFLRDDEEDNKANKIYYIDFDKNADCTTGDMDYVYNRLGIAYSSTGEGIMQRFGRICQFIGSTIRDLEEGSELVLFLDDCDAGTSLDMISDIVGLFPLIINDCEKRGINVYIVITANSYELCRYCDCISVHDFKHKTFKSYESYKKFVLKSREKKENRGW